MEALTARIKEANERITDIEDKMIENKEAERKREINNYWIMRGESDRQVIS